MPLETVRRKLGELRPKLTPTGLFPNDLNVARPPPIPEQIAKRTNTKKDKRNPSSAKGKDTNSYFNVLREVGNFVRDHNQKHANDPNMQYRWYGTDVEDKSRAETLMRIVGDLAPSVIGSLYGMKTYDMLRREKPEHIELLVLMTALDENFDPLTQGVRIFPTRKMVAAKLYSKRKVQRAAEERERKRNLQAVGTSGSGEVALNASEQEIKISLPRYSIEDVPSGVVVPDISPDVEPIPPVSAAVMSSAITATERHSGSVRFQGIRTMIADGSYSNSLIENGSDSRNTHEQNIDEVTSARTRPSKNNSTPPSRGSSTGVVNSRPIGSSSLKAPLLNDSGAPPRARKKINFSQRLSIPRQSGKKASRVRVSPLARGRRKDKEETKTRGQRPSRRGSKQVQGNEGNQRDELLARPKDALDAHDDVMVAGAVENLAERAPEHNSGRASSVSASNGKMLADFQAWLESRDAAPEPTKAKGSGVQKRGNNKRVTRGKRKRADMYSGDEIDNEIDNESFSDEESS